METEDKNEGADREAWWRRGVGGGSGTVCIEHPHPVHHPMAAGKQHCERRLERFVSVRACWDFYHSAIC